MEKQFYRWELALMFGVVAVLLGGIWIQEEQQELADNMIRLHVIANSDSEEDQVLKLKVRDRILEEAQVVYDGCVSRGQVRHRMEEELERLEQAGAQVVAEHGYQYSVRAEMAQCWFPTKEYENFSLPAGEYTALRVVIGEGEGQNWWCVAFPPLCVGAASQTLEESVAVGAFTEEQAQLMTRQGNGYILKFKGMELLGGLRQRLTELCGMEEMLQK